MITTMLQVALGGAIGAAARYATGVGVVRIFGLGAFPIGVITVNILGSFLMGVLVVFLAQKSLTHLNPILMTGVLGGFTTFSAFSLEAYTLLERGETGLAAVYVGASVIFSLAALVAGVYLMRAVLA